MHDEHILFHPILSSCVSTERVILDDTAGLVRIYNQDGQVVIKVPQSSDNALIFAAAASLPSSNRIIIKRALPSES